MRYSLFLPAVACIALLARNADPPDLQLELIRRLDGLVQTRFQDPLPFALGMSRIMTPSSFGKHFHPAVTSQRDFQPENPAEREVIAKLEECGLQVGLYLFGAAIVSSTPENLDFRALKGPGTVTGGTPRPRWYPLLNPGVRQADALPDWNAMFPLARKAMNSFQDGGTGFETTFESCNIAARPVMASEQRCVACHNNQAFQSKVVAQLHRPIGGVLYVWREANQ